MIQYLLDYLQNSNLRFTTPMFYQNDPDAFLMQFIGNICF